MIFDTRTVKEKYFNSVKQAWLATENNHFKDFVLSTCYQLIFISIARSKAFFSPEYLARIERLLKMTMCYYDSFNLDMTNSFEGKNQNKYRKLLDGLFFS